MALGSLEPNDYPHHNCSRYLGMEWRLWAEKAWVGSPVGVVDRLLAVGILHVAADRHSCIEVVGVHIVVEGKVADNSEGRIPLGIPLGLDIVARGQTSWKVSDVTTSPDLWRKPDLRLRLFERLNVFNQVNRLRHGVDEIRGERIPANSQGAASRKKKGPEIFCEGDCRSEANSNASP